MMLIKQLMLHKSAKFSQVCNYLGQHSTNTFINKNGINMILRLSGNFKVEAPYHSSQTFIIIFCKQLHVNDKISLHCYTHID